MDVNEINYGKTRYRIVPNSVRSNTRSLAERERTFFVSSVAVGNIPSGAISLNVGTVFLSPIKYVRVC
jgi:hypothetical protein